MRTVAHTVSAAVLIRAITFPITALVSIATTSLIIGEVGNIGFGAITLVTSLTLLIPYTDLGLGAAVINAMAVEDLIERRNATLNAVFTLTCASGLITAVMGVLGSCLFSWSNVLPLAGSNVTHIDAFVSAFVVLFGITVPLGLGQRILTGANRGPIGTALLAITPLLTFMFTLVAVRCGLLSGALILAPALAAFAGTLVTFTVAVRIVRWRPKLRMRIGVGTLQDVLGQGIWYVMITLASATILQLGRVILGWLSGLSASGQFALVMQLYGPVWSVFLVGTTVLWPTFARLRRDSLAEAGRLMRVATLLVLSFGLVCITSFALLGPAFLALLSHGRIIVGTFACAACGVMIAVQGMQVLYGVFLTRRADLKFQACWGLCAAALSVGIAVLLVPVWGVAAPFLSASLALAVGGVLPNVLRVRRLLEPAASIAPGTVKHA